MAGVGDRPLRHTTSLVVVVGKLSITIGRTPQTEFVRGPSGPEEQPIRLGPLRHHITSDWNNRKWKDITPSTRMLSNRVRDWIGGRTRRRNRRWLRSRSLTFDKAQGVQIRRSKPDWTGRFPFE